ncbi:hypothetical protein SLEP1_g18727 [Rubroshorea leprosula]|uniref:Uncharacterized protein n=1 Tax=Rubroshorea leprosula TaxID=152421 RepID=A0AAV5JAD0_9ROSI|nr:hypothetical protein SLEP1_g18727 [Rubroshorea leprosula]
MCRHYTRVGFLVSFCNFFNGKIADLVPDFWILHKLILKSLISSIYF